MPAVSGEERFMYNDYPVEGGTAEGSASVWRPFTEVKKGPPHLIVVPNVDEQSIEAARVAYGTWCDHVGSARIDYTLLSEAQIADLRQQRLASALNDLEHKQRLEREALLRKFA